MTGGGARGTPRARAWRRRRAPRAGRARTTPPSAPGSGLWGASPAGALSGCRGAQRDTPPSAGEGAPPAPLGGEGGGPPPAEPAGRPPGPPAPARGRAGACLCVPQFNSILLTSTRFQLNSPRFQLNPPRFSSIQLNSAQFSSAQLKSTQLNSAQLNSTQLNATAVDGRARCGAVRAHRCR